MPLDWTPPGDAFFAARALPSNIVAEQALLGAIMANPKALDRVVDFLEPEHFATAVNGRIYAEQRKRIQAGGIADAVALKVWFESDQDFGDLKGLKYLAQLAASMVAINTSTEYGKSVADAWRRRQIIAASSELSELAYDGSQDTTAAAKEALDRIEAIMSARGATDRQMSLNAAMDAAVSAMERVQRGEPSRAISTGFTCINERLGGLEPGMVYVIGGRPGMGKSSVGTQIAVNVARQNVGVLELSLEMSAEQLGRRVLATAADLPIMAIKRGTIGEDGADRLVRARREVANLPLTIDDAAGQSASQIATKARIARRKHNVGLIMVDHLNLMRPEGEDAKNGGTWAIERASGTMLQVAKDCDCPVLLLAQLNRGVEGRDDKRPNLSDLRQAGAIEQDAYAVGFVYREEYYLQGEPSRKDNESDAKYSERTSAWLTRKHASKGMAELIWAKVRDGEPGIDRLTFDGPTATFGEPDHG